MVINVPGSYYLATNIVVTNGTSTAITITTNDVTVDLNGFALKNTTTNGQGRAINIGAVNNVRIRNGSIAGFANAIWFLAQSKGIRIEDMYVTQTRETAIFGFAVLGVSTGSVHIARCVVEDLGLPLPTQGTTMSGIVLQTTEGVVEDCTVRDIRGGLGGGGGTGIFFTATTNSMALRNKVIKCATGISMTAGVAFRDNVAVGCGAVCGRN